MALPRTCAIFPAQLLRRLQDFWEKQQFERRNPRPRMNRSAWEIFQGATLSLARAGALKDRLYEAYRNHIACIDETELPRDLREDFRSFNHTLTRERPLLRGEDAVRATIRKMSNGEAEAAASAVVKMCCALQRRSISRRNPARRKPEARAASPGRALNPV
jgi:hypothetical protein